MGWISRGCFNVVVVVVVGFLFLAAVAVLFDIVEVSAGLVLYLIVLVALLGGLWFMVRAWLEPANKDQKQRKN